MFLVGFASAILVPRAGAQGLPAQKPARADAVATAQRGIDLAEKGHCREALSLLRAASRVPDKGLRKKTGLAVVKCSLALNQSEAAVNALLALNRDFPHDPQVLYVTTHAYSDLATRAAEDLANNAPKSAQAIQLNAEAYETQGKWDDAATQYRKILAQDPDTPGIHFRLGRIILSEPATSTTAEDAKKEFEAELKIDPNNAGAEYILGELAAQAQEPDQAIAHLARATELDPSFADAFRSLGMALNAAGKFSDAVPPLETYVKMQPADPAGHYQLAIACARSGRKEEASREMALQRQMDEAVRKAQGQAGDPGQPPNHPQ
jgi:predicted Zn-dependent protease